MNFDKVLGKVIEYRWKKICFLSTPAPFQLERDDFLEIMQFVLIRFEKKAVTRRLLAKLCGGLLFPIWYCQVATL
jgi:hypothetical protein